MLKSKLIKMYENWELHLMTGEPDPLIPEPSPRGCLIQTVIAMLAIILFAICCSGCKSSGCNITEDMMAHDTCYITQLLHDSIQVHDSIYEREYLKGDTVIQYKYVQKLKYKDRLQHDSVYIHQTDTITNTVTKEVEKKLSTWERIKIFAGDGILWTFILVFAYLLIWAKKNM